MSWKHGGDLDPDFVLPLDSVLGDPQWGQESFAEALSNAASCEGGPGTVERVLVVVRRDGEPTDGIGIARVRKMPRVVRLGLSVWLRKTPHGFRVAGAEE